MTTETPLIGLVPADLTPAERRVRLRCAAKEATATIELWLDPADPQPWDWTALRDAAVRLLGQSPPPQHLARALYAIAAARRGVLRLRVTAESTDGETAGLASG